MIYIGLHTFLPHQGIYHTPPTCAAWPRPSSPTRHL